MDERYDMMRSLMNYRYLYIHNYRPELPYVPRLSYMFQARGYQSWVREAIAARLTGSSPTSSSKLDTNSSANCAPSGTP